MKYKCIICQEEFDDMNAHLQDNPDTRHEVYAQYLDAKCMLPEAKRPKCFCGGNIKAWAVSTGEDYIVECAKCGYVIHER